MKVVECFCGAGLSSIGIVRAGGDLVGACDYDHSAVTMFNSQPGLLPPVATCCDLDTYEIPPCDLLSGGPVCKAFSPGAAIFGTKGKDDDRNTFPLFFRAIDRSKPKHILIENSFGMERFGDEDTSDPNEWPLTGMASNGYIDEIVGGLKNRGYKVDWTEVDCYDFGVPQHRRRLIFLGSKTANWKMPAVFAWDREGPCTVGECMGPVPENDPWPLTKPCTEAEMTYLLRDPDRLKRHPSQEMHKAGHTVVSVYRKGAPYGTVRMKDKSLHMCGPRLAARLQGLPDSFKFNMVSRSKAFEAIGNGFPPQVIEAAVKSLLEVLNGQQV